MFLLFTLQNCFIPLFIRNFFKWHLHIRLLSKPISSSKVEGAYWGSQRMRILIAANPLKPKKFESAIFWGWVYEAQNRSVLNVHKGHLGKSQISPKPHEDSSIKATNKFAEEIGFKREIGFERSLILFWRLLLNGEKNTY
ncbi:MAG: hypothetical protein LBS83_03380 [Holosporales bacterium]|jgi:hypothetical protein|nr:hypothetical protein [Holosporales bacterium]